MEPQETGPPVVAAPELPYQPRHPERYRPNIGLIGCGAITTWHLRAYRKAGFRVTAFCDIRRANAKKQRDEFYPQADVFTDHTKLLKRDDIEVVDIATHPPVRPALIEAALRAGKHVLSQKPFVEDVDVGAQLAELAEQKGVLLAVNQNGRWAPHWSYLRQAVTRRILGDLLAVHCEVHWDHGWVNGTAFENVRHLILFDFAIHWFDLLCSLMGEREPRRVYASFRKSATQTVRPALLGQVAVEYDGAQATLVFDGDTRFGPWETTYVTGGKGTLSCWGPNSRKQSLTLATAQGTAKPKLEGDWFPDGFHGTMGELLLAIAEKRAPSHSARNNLASLALCFAAVASAERGEPIVPGTVRSLTEAQGE